MTFVTDPIGDLLTRMRNAQAARKQSCRAPLSRLKRELCELLKKEGYLEDVQVIGDAPHQELEVTFVPEKQLMVQRVSKPGRRVYSNAAHLSPILRGYGLAILTTSEGLMTDKAARKQNIGGEVLCTIA